MKTFLYTPDDVFSGTRDISGRSRPETNTTTSVARQNRSGRMKEDMILHECGDELLRSSVQCVNQREYVNQTRYGELYYDGRNFNTYTQYYLRGYKQ